MPANTGQPKAPVPAIFVNGTLENPYLDRIANARTCGHRFAHIRWFCRLY